MKLCQACNRFLYSFTSVFLDLLSASLPATECLPGSKDGPRWPRTLGRVPGCPRTPGEGLDFAPWGLFPLSGLRRCSSEVLIPCPPGIKALVVEGGWQASLKRRLHSRLHCLPLTVSCTRENHRQPGKRRPTWSHMGPSGSVYMAWLTCSSPTSQVPLASRAGPSTKDRLPLLPLRVLPPKVFSGPVFCPHPRLQALLSRDPDLPAL